MTATTSGTRKPTVLMLLSNGFLPDPRVHKEAKTLVENGYGVAIVCMDRGDGLPAEEIVDGIAVHRIHVGAVLPGEILSVGKSLASYYLRSAKEITRLFCPGQIDAVHCNDLDTVLLGLALGKRYRVPVVYDMHDQYSSFLKNPLARRAVNRLDALCCKLADGIIVVNEDFLEIPFIDPDKTKLVMNVPPSAGSGMSTDTEAGLFYAGNFDLSRDMRYAMRVFDSSGLAVTFAGDGPLLKDTQRQAASEHVRFLGRIPAEEVFAQTARCLAVLALYDPSYPNNRLASPNKLFDAMKYGKPALVSAGTVMARIVDENQCGLVVEYGDADSLSRAIRTLGDRREYERMCKNALDAFEGRYSWEVMTPNLLQLYESLTGHSFRRRRPKE